MCNLKALPINLPKVGLVFLMWVALTLAGDSRAEIRQDASADATSPLTSSSEKCCKLEGFEVGLSFPQPLFFGLFTHPVTKSSIQFYGDVGFFRWPIFGSGRGILSYGIEVGARVAPIKPWWIFFVGIGYRSLSYEANLSQFTIEGEQVATSATLRVGAVYLTLGTGVRFGVSDRISLGTDIGVQIPMIPVGSMNLENAATGEDSSSSETLSVDPVSARFISGLIIPQLTLLRMTYKF